MHAASAGATFLALTRGQNSANNISRATRRAMWTAFPVLGRPEASSANRGPKSPPQEPPENPPLRALLDPIRPQDTCKTQLKADRDVNNRCLENVHGASAGATFLALTRGQNSGKKYFRSHPQSNVDRIPGQKRGRAKKQGKWSLTGRGGGPPPTPGLRSRRP